MREMSKMAKLVLILLTATIASFAIAGIIFYAEYGGNFSGLDGNALRMSNSVDVDEEKTQPVTGVSNIYVNTTSDEINIIKTDSNELKARFHGTYSTNDREYGPEFTMTASGGEIRIKVEYKPHIGILMFNSSLKLDVYLPAAYAKNLDIRATSADVNVDEIASLEGFSCKTSSGNIRAGLVNAGKAELSATSGNISINGAFDSIKCGASSGQIESDRIKAKSAAFDTTSGDIRVNADADELMLNASSGNVTAGRVYSNSCRAETSSGTITLSGNPGKLETSSSSGDVNLTYDEFAGDINVSTTSGNVGITLPQNAEFHLSYRTSSGSGRVDFPVTVYGGSNEKGIEGTVVSDRNTIQINTSSGNLDITK
jgi:DUF4097 and DUF4098 domain-containing protein YvlB